MSTEEIESKLKIDLITDTGFLIEQIVNDLEGRIQLDISLNLLLRDTIIDEDPSFSPAW